MPAVAVVGGGGNIGKYVLPTGSDKSHARKNK